MFNYERLYKLHEINKLKKNRSLTMQEAQRFEITLVPNPDHKSPNPFFRQHPDKAISLGVKVPLLLGFTSREGSFFQRSKFFFAINNNTFQTVPRYEFRYTIIDYQ